MGRLHCTEDPVPEAVGGDMQQLNQLGAQQFSALTEVLFHFLTEPKEVERFLAQLSEFATTNQMSLGSLRSIVKSLLVVPNGLSEEKATYFSEKWKQNAPTLARWAIGQTLMINQLIDMEWKFGVTSGSSELEKVGSIFLQLKLVVKKGNQIENVYIDWGLLKGRVNLRFILVPSWGLVQHPASSRCSTNVNIGIQVPSSPHSRDPRLPLPLP
ncbi:COMM domain-containing protein 7 isoform X4 [Symphalangus syndactylus]|uniref:COMM domain-containing protein 7 isoform X4 n=1 Tax=Symphalangus syndactylus TaxID=9590 RepID=UPI003007C8B9